MQNGILTEIELTELNSLPEPAVRPNSARLVAAQDNDLVGAGEVKRGTGPLVQHVAVEMFRTHQRDAPFERAAVGIERGQSRLGDLDLLSEAEPGEQAALALHE